LIADPKKIIYYAMLSEEEVKALIKALLKDTRKAIKEKKVINAVGNILNFLREKEIREEINRKWEELEKQKSESFVSDVHEYTENIGTLNINSVKKTRSGVEIHFTGIAGGLTEFGTELTYEITGILPLVKSGKLKKIKWLKRGLIDTKPFEMNEFSED
jgi:hypothetical protein